MSTPASPNDLPSQITAKPKRRWSRRRMLLGLACLAGATYTDMRFIEPQWLGVGRHRVPILPEGAAPIRILQLSDLHVSKDTSLAFIEKAVALGLNTKPDIICLTGDYITVTWEDWEGYAEVLRPLAASVPCYATTGNHDGGGWMERHGGYPNASKVIAMLENANARVMMNEYEVIRLPGKEPFELMGFGDMWAHEFRPHDILRSVAYQLPRVVMSHNPDTKDQIGGFQWDLMLSGHTHGGQLTLPWGSTPFAPVRDHRFVRGLHRWENHWLHVTKGVGSIRKMRLNCFPEVSVIDLVAKTA